MAIGSVTAFSACCGTCPKVPQEHNFEKPVRVQACAEKKDCFAEHQAWRGLLWLAAAGQNLCLNLAPFLWLNPVYSLQSSVKYYCQVSGMAG